MPNTESTTLSRMDGGQPGAPPGSSKDLRDRSATDLVRSAFDEGRRLAQLEVAIAREEARADVRQAKRVGGALGAAGALALSAFTLFMVAIAAAFTKIWLAGLVMGGIVLALSGALGLAGRTQIPEQPLGETRARIRADLTKVKEQVRS